MVALASKAASRSGAVEKKSVEQLLRAIRKLPEDKPVKNPRKWYLTQREHWIGWLTEYNGPGAYNRKTHSGRDAEFVYNHIVEPEMLIYLAEATRMDRALIARARRIARGKGTLMQKAGAIRRLIPWNMVEAVLWPAKNASDRRKGRPELFALTVRQPWVHAILHEGKDVENRSWKRDFRGWLAIHAAANPSRDARFPRGVPTPDLAKLDYSAIVAVARVDDICRSHRSKWFYKAPRGEINYGWVLGCVRKLKTPIPCKGALGLWRVPKEIAAKIRRQLPGLNWNS